MSLFDSYYATGLNPSDFSLGAGQLQGLGDVGNWNPYSGGFDLGSLNLSQPQSSGGGLSTDIGSLNLGGAGGMVGGESLWYDTQTQQFVTPQQMMQIDPAAAQEALSGAGGQPTTNMQAPGLPPAGGPGSSSTDNLLKYLAYAGAGIGGVLGLAGALQTAQGKGDKTTTEMQRDVAPAGAGESALTDALMRQAMQGQGPYNQLTSQIQQASDLQMQIMQALGPTATGLARGSVPLTPELQRTVETAFTPQLGSIAQQAIESARQRGFPGGAELLGQGPAGAIAGPALADLQGQIAAAKLQYATGLPMQAAQIMQMLSGSAGQAGQLQQGQFGGGLNLLQLQQNARMGAAGQNTTQQTYPGAPLANAAQGFGNVLGGVGGALGGYAAINRPQLDPYTYYGLSGQRQQ